MINKIQNQSESYRKARFVFLQTMLFLLLIALCECHYAIPEQNSAIVIITKDAQESKDYAFPFTTMRVYNRGNIVYVDTSLNEMYYKLRALPYDTITIYSDHDNFEIRHDYSAFDCVYYLLNRGDTLFLSYTDKYIPYAKILNRSFNENELNYDYLFAKQFFQHDTLSIRGALSYYSLMSDFNYRYIPMKEKAKEQLQYLLNEQLAYLDSLWKNWLISEAHYSYRKNNILSAFFLNDLGSVTNSSFFLSDSLFLKYDSLIYLDFYRKLISNYISIKNQSKTPDVQIKFDKVIYSSNYSNAVKKYVFRSLAEELREYVQNNDLEKLLTAYRTITDDSITYNDLKEQFGLLRPDNLEILLRDTTGESTTLNQLMEKYKGKYIYIDFWATWCIPCRELLDDNAKLGKDYHNKNIVFVSLAFNDDEKNWLKYLSDNKDKFGHENYFITNTKSSRIIEKWEIKSIPRYMLFDEKGEIAIYDAPRPNTKEVRAIFNKLLK